MLTPYAHNERIQVLEAILVDMRNNPPPLVCRNCLHLSGAGACDKFGPIAPERQTTPGCPEWEEGVPF